MNEEKTEKKGITQKLYISVKQIKKDDFENLISSYRQQRYLWQTKKVIHGHDINFYLKKLKDRDEATAIILETINSKLDQILNFLKINIEKSEDFKSQSVYLTSDSILCRYNENLPKETLLEIKIKLDGDLLTCFGTVVKSEKKGEDFLIAAKFIWIMDEDQDRLVEYLIKQEILSEKFKRGLKNID